MKNKILVPKRVMEAPDVSYGVCLWRLPDGTYIQNSAGEYLCAQAKLNDPGTTKKMRKAAKSMGIEEGEPMWLPGFRAISDMEHDDQMADLLDGKVPDLVDAYWQSKLGVDHGGR